MAGRFYFYVDELSTHSTDDSCDYFLINNTQLLLFSKRKLVSK